MLPVPRLTPQFRPFVLSVAVKNSLRSLRDYLLIPPGGNPPPLHHQPPPLDSADGPRVTQLSVAIRADISVTAPCIHRATR